ncbi:prolyl oligopeptidase family serine peptidase [Lysobacter maris]|uniref:Prolyl oligopeptidase family serine peptidase n=1 Tax=Marilutibacter maris TaxID=1605891 RepID=A0A507ZSB8_9GAMM|nr:prolyl oligopeptidase family serine peptidase [Lysobacter maris]KAB8162080.1 prolyl oligopeptidase family serine peptidase [Lysobacter maris]
MRRVRLLTLLAALAVPGVSVAVDADPDRDGYRLPPEPIRALAEAPPLPDVLSDSRGRVLVMLRREALPSLQALSRPQMRLAGLDIDVGDGVTRSSLDSLNARTRLETFSGIELRRLDEDRARPVSGLPAHPRLSFFTWSPDETRLAFTHATGSGLEVWVLALDTGQARRLTGANANGVLGNPLTWFRDGAALLVRMRPAATVELSDPRLQVPAAPLISVSDGNLAPARTYQNLLRTAVDDANFDALATSRLYRVPLRGEPRPWAGPSPYRRTAFSPDGRYLLVESLRKPYSRRVPVDRFAARTQLLDPDGEPVMTVADLPPGDDLPRGRMAATVGKRQIGWRADRPAELVWTEALDDGDPAVQVAHRDALFAWAAPFADSPRLLLKTVNRHIETLWGDDRHAIAIDAWWETRNTRSYLFAPGEPARAPRLLDDRDMQDRYADPGLYQTELNGAGEPQLILDHGRAYRIGEGFGPDGQHPFLDRIDLTSGVRERLYQSTLEEEAESLIGFAGGDRSRLLVSIESPTRPPAHFVRDLEDRTRLRRLTEPANPYAAMNAVKRSLLTYARDDGIALSGTLHLPAGFDPGQSARLPLILWAYPVEYRDAGSASQVAVNPRRFVAPDYMSPAYWALRGFAVLDKASFPIVGEAGVEPNDTYLEQLLGNARAAIDALDRQGIVDRQRVVAMGHSYGAFMVANLLTHSDYFAAGIARSGAYNRTLTPFGFQREQRSYWQAPQVYTAMSPFMSADRMKTPLLLIHGGADANASTSAMQSERYFAALQALGAPARLVILPNENHRYLARESVLHTLWEQDRWLQRHAGDADGGHAGDGVSRGE